MIQCHIAVVDNLTVHGVCVVVYSGESGAGKTENTKKVIGYFALVAAASTKKEEDPSAADQV